MLGFGFIRSVYCNKTSCDNTSVTFHIVTPVSPQNLERVDILARGSCMEFPPLLYLSGSANGGPYTFKSALEGIAGANPKRMRYNLQRRRLQSK